MEITYNLNYTSDTATIIGMMNSNCELNYNVDNSYYKNKKHTKVVYNYVNNDNIDDVLNDIVDNDIEQATLMYCDDNIVDNALAEDNEGNDKVLAFESHFKMQLTYDESSTDDEVISNEIVNNIDNNKENADVPVSEEKQSISVKQCIKDNYNISKYKMEQIVSELDTNVFFNEKSDLYLKGKLCKEVRGPINKYKDIIIVRNIYNSKDDVLNMIEEWRYMNNGGIKYGFQERAGVDKALVKRYYKDELAESYMGFAFYIYDKELNKEKCIGYAITKRKPSDFIYDKQKDKYYPVFNYMNRKVLCLDGYRNLTEYIDWYVFNSLYEQTKINAYDNDIIYINWGCSSGGVKWYKEHKWPLYYKQHKWFYTIKKKKT